MSLPIRLRRRLQSRADQGRDRVPADPRSRRLQQLLPAHSALRDVDVDLASLTEWSIAGRYPADARDANDGDAKQAVRDARVVVDALAATFALPPEEQSAER